MSTTKSLDIESMAGPRHALTLTAKGQKTRSRVIKCKLCVYSPWQVRHGSAFQYDCTFL